MTAEQQSTVGSERFVVTGCQRSGTTLLGMALEAHPRIDFMDESDRRFHTKGDLGRTLDLAAVVARVGSAGRLAGFKAPRDSHRVEEIDRALPSVRIVWVEREVRQVVASMLSLATKTGSWASQQASVEIAKHLEVVDDEPARGLLVAADELRDDRATAVALAALCWAVKRGQRHAAMQILGSRLFVVDYDELVTAPDRTLEGLLDFLEVGWSQDVLDHPSAVDHSPEFRRPGKADSSRVIDTESQRKWTLLSPEDLAVIETIEQCYREGISPDW